MFFASNNENYFNKILFTILLIVFLIMILFSSCFASSEQIYVTNFQNNDVYIILEDSYLSYDYLFITYTDYSSYLGVNIICSNSFPSYSSGKLVPSGPLYIIQYTTLEGYVIDTNTASINISYSYNVGSVPSKYVTNSSSIVYSNFDVIDNDTDEIIFGNSSIPEVQNPYIINTDEELQTGKFENIKISNGDFDIYNGHYYLHTAYVDTSLAPGTSYYINEKVFILDSECSYKYTGTDSSILNFSVPKSKLGFTLENGKKYIFVLSSSANSLSNITTDQIFDNKEFTVSGLTTDDNIQDNQDIMNDKLDEQTNAIKENTETNKGIWETIKDILSYINPFSENFFVYKLIELLVEAIKSLFIPSDDFLGTYFTDLKEWFSDRLGFLFYPFELVIDILNMILDIDFSEPVFNIPDITEPFSNKKLISATTFKFNDLLENNTFNTIHSIYLVCVDVFVVFGLVNLFRRKYEEVTTK